MSTVIVKDDILIKLNAKSPLNDPSYAEKNSDKLLVPAPRLSESKRHMGVGLWKPNWHDIPINILPLDVLSLIFEICGRWDWIDAVRISGVCRVWRQCVLSTPRAWAFLSLINGRNYPDIRRYLTLSACLPLHISLGVNQPFTRLSGETYRLHCLRIGYIQDPMSTLEFTALQTLIVDIIYAPYVTETRFPLLQHLWCKSGFLIPHKGGTVDTLPKLRTLSTSTDGSSVWIEVIRHCCESLTSLRIGEYGSGRSAICAATLPRLECLELYCEARSMRPISLRTPKLRTYIESRRPSISDSRLAHDDLETVENIRLRGGPYPCLPRGVHILQITVRNHEDMKFISQCLQSNAYPRLHSIELQEEAKDSPLKYGLSHFRLPENPWIKVFIVTSFSDLPGMLPAVYDTIPCDSIRLQHI
ncbi:hypothetical protein M408DRAFT_23566 [Serendipita vermifera MAFF 305830]|uniref:F-box domain-containing protein n=1 Tax=Serendipita vermifera MAFF 305830 TaxID=933852 RepID=A0A0C2WQM9_SERVB|nr:hypothetical protein M408DRAFT_23566 [Serendipita vermifera MAFF 305830]